eukprot:CAMPEP_0197197644 /NCGR_PEP_ID=MMETSP1423-20130617/32970_1 /TAXON_ID=476441 /ORGANISM="Pseudo-nitzschia heimii, Strain UNC1101" /LENGTH=950 /DNA_ID=CAMNT_0042651469 /DNA_START=42 /DNA_END=2892 /DNA_ORIENTATION=+
MSSPRRLRRNLTAEIGEESNDLVGIGPASPVASSPSLSSSSPQRRHNLREKSKNSNTLTVHHYHHYDDQKHIHHHVNHRRQHPSLSPRKRQKGKFAKSTKRMCVTGMIALVWSMLTAVYVFRSSSLPDVENIEEDLRKRKESFAKKKPKTKPKPNYLSSLTPRELAYDPVRKGAPPRPMREPSGSNSAASNNATWEFVKLRVGVRTTGDAEKREVTAVHDREVLERWCPQPSSRVLETPRMVVAADYRDERPTHPHSFHYVVIDYRSFYADAGLIIDKLFELVAGDPPPANAIVGDNVTALNISTTAVPEPKVHKAAICRIRDWTNVLLQHFAHAMEEIYMCFGYWVESGALSNTTDVTPVLLYNGATQGKYLMDSAFLTNTFMKGIKEFLTTELGLVILKQEDYYRCHFPRAAWDIPTAAGSARALQMADLCDSLYHPDQTIRTHNVKGKYGYFFEHVAEWNQLMTRWLNRKDVLRELRKATRKKTAKPPVSGTSSANGSNLENHDRQQQQRRRLTGLTERGVTKPETVLRESLNGACFRPPRIAILNRRKTRVVLNADELATDLSELVYVYRKTDGTNKTHQIRAQHPAEVIFFEDKEFIEQVEFFRRTDILISAHGAQLTGLPFMATDLVGGKSCKQVLELYPKDYGLPYYFGSLAVQSGLEHNYVYYDDGLDMVYNFTGAALPVPPRKDHLRDRKPLVELKPWETLTSKEYMGRAAARGYKFCPRRDDAVDYVAALIAEWYRCHGCGTATTTGPATATAPTSADENRNGDNNRLRTPLRRPENVGSTPEKIGVGYTTVETARVSVPARRGAAKRGGDDDDTCRGAPACRLRRSPLPSRRVFSGGGALPSLSVRLRAPFPRERPPPHRSRRERTDGGERNSPTLDRILVGIHPLGGKTAAVAFRERPEDSLVGERRARVPTAMREQTKRHQTIARQAAASNYGGALC